ncbi:MAG: hypothetical protein H6722_08960 [Sandaracinus sp.]|nr:hypothetical protein [Sandaracinus sp.]
MGPGFGGIETREALPQIGGLLGAAAEIAERDDGRAGTFRWATAAGSALDAVGRTPGHGARRGRTDWTFTLGAVSGGHREASTFAGQGHARQIEGLGLLGARRRPRSRRRRRALGAWGWRLPRRGRGRGLRLGLGLDDLGLRFGLGLGLDDLGLRFVDRHDLHFGGRGKRLERRGAQEIQERQEPHQERDADEVDDE